MFLKLWMFQGKNGFASRVYFNLKLEFVVLTSTNDFNMNLVFNQLLHEFNYF